MTARANRIVPCARSSTQMRRWRTRAGPEAFLDWLVDQYLPVLDSIEERIETIEDRVVEQPSPQVLSEIFTCAAR